MERHLSQDEIAELALGVASDTEATEWRAHLAECQKCRAALQADLEILQAGKEYPMPEMSEERWCQLLEHAMESKRRLKLETGFARRATPTFPLKVWGLQAAVMLIVFLIGYLVGISSTRMGVSSRETAPVLMVGHVQGSKELTEVKRTEAATQDVYRVAVSDSPVARTIQPVLVSHHKLSSSDQLEAGTINEEFMGI